VVRALLATVVRALLATVVRAPVAGASTPIAGHIQTVAAVRTADRGMTADRGLSLA
jgi:hypothetical protein